MLTRNVIQSTKKPVNAFCIYSEHKPNNSPTSLAGSDQSIKLVQNTCENISMRISDPLPRSGLIVWKLLLAEMRCYGRYETGKYPNSIRIFKLFLNSLIYSDRFFISEL